MWKEALLGRNRGKEMALTGSSFGRHRSRTPISRNEQGVPKGRHNHNGGATKISAQATGHSKEPVDKIFEKVISPYLTEVLQHPQSIEMCEGMLHIRDVEGPKKTGSVETRLEAMEQQVFKCQGMVDRGLNANHMLIMKFTNKHKIDANDIGKHLSRLYDRVDQLEGQIYDLQNQNFS
ncbi:40S ribosomal protein S5-1 [Hordeum vulgare]|nr:40S ribosomal protein S5-1 [Hordeum vulgare]